MSAQAVLSRLVGEHVHPLLKAAGFKKKALTFYRTVDRNHGLVNLQKSKTSTATSVEFTINLAVFSARLQEGLGAITWVPTVSDVPIEPACHLRRRIGALLPDRRDLWWGVRQESDAAEVARSSRRYSGSSRFRSSTVALRTNASATTGSRVPKERSRRGKGSPSPFSFATSDLGMLWVRCSIGCGPASRPRR
jgi:hypothetical protein